MASVSRVVTLVVSLACIAHVGRRPDGHLDDRRDQRHRHRQHQVGAAGRDRHALRPVPDGHQRRRHRSERSLSFLERADRRLQADLRAGRLRVDRARGDPRWRRLHRHRQRRDEPGRRSNESITVSGATPVVDVQSTKVAQQLRQRAARRAAGLARCLGGRGADARRRDVAHGRRRQHRVDAAGVPGVRRRRRRAQRGRRDPRQRGLRPDVLHRLLLVRGDLGDRRRQHGGSRHARRLQQLRQQVGEQHLPRQRLLRLRERRDGSAQHRRCADRGGREGQPVPRRAGSESPLALPRLHRRHRRLPEEGSAVVVLRLPQQRRRPPLPDAGRRHPAHLRTGLQRQGHRQPRHRTTS